MESCFRQAFHSILKKPVQKEDSHSEVLRVGRYQLLLRRVCSRERDGYIAIFLFDGEANPTPDPVSLKKLFRFTNAESRLAILLAQGCSLEDATEILGITKNTARTHLRAIFVKCGVSRQASLVQKIVTSPAMLLH
jgi:DNA-binding CsgD family transcriptional regulator